MADNDERAIAAAQLIDEHMFDGRNDHGYDRCDCDWVGRSPGEWPDHLADVLETAGLLTDPEQRAELRRLQRVVERLPYRQRDYDRARLELRKLNDAMARKNRTITKLKRERDLAVAHDRQPYPTAHAYERACRTIRAKCDRIDAIRAVLDAADDWEHLTPGEVRALSTALHGPAGSAVTPPDPSGRITDSGPVEPFHSNDSEVPDA